jgi:uncharacterized protein (TIGR04255 family)
MSPMSNDLACSGRFEPIHEAHAIEQVAFVLQFDRPLNDAQISMAIKIAEGFKEDLPGLSAIQELAFAISPMGAIPPNSIAGGAVFYRSKPDGSREKELLIERSSIAFKTSFYTQWDSIWGQARQYLSPVAKLYASHVRLLGISLNYSDKFIWHGDLAKCKPNMLLREQSKYLCSHIFDVTDLWHSHTGAFLQADSKTRRLLNLNIDILNESNIVAGDKRIIAITSVLTDFLNQPGYEASNVQGDDVFELIDSHMESMHVFGKKILAEILTDEMAKRIALGD